MVTVSAASGLGNHIHLLSHDQLVKALKWSWMSQIVAVQAIGFGKIAVIAFLLRIQVGESLIRTPKPLTTFRTAPKPRRPGSSISSGAAM